MKEKKKLRSDGPVLLRLLHGSWGYFTACILSGLIFTACELVIPQIIRVSVDSFIGEKPVSVAAVGRWVERFGGVENIRRHMWIPAAVMAALGLISALFRYFTAQRPARRS